MPRFSAYVASKSALDAFSRCIASEMVDDRVAITTIHMPLVRTPMIAPTKMYDRFPTMTPDEAPDMIMRGDHPPAEADRDADGDLGQIIYAINPKSIDYILNTAYHMFPDSTAAKGDKDKPKSSGSNSSASKEPQTTNEAATNQQVAFAYLMRGMHW